MKNLEVASLVEKPRNQRPYEYDAESISLTLSTDGETQTITPALIAPVARREEDITEKADSPLVGLDAQVLDTRGGDSVAPLMTDKPTGRAAERLLPRHDFSDHIEFRYTSVEYLETITANEFR